MKWLPGFKRDYIDFMDKSHKGMPYMTSKLRHSISVAIIWYMQEGLVSALRTVYR